MDLKERNFLIELHEARLYHHVDAVERTIKNLARKASRRHMEELVAAWTKAQLELWDVAPKEAA